MKKLLPIHILLILLILLSLWSAFLWNGVDVNSWVTMLSNLALLAVSGMALRGAIRTFIEPGYVTRPENRLITLLILFLLFDSLTPWWIFLILGAVTEILQYFFRSNSGPLFNPAAFSALLVSTFGFLPSWWGVNPEPRVSFSGIDISIPAIIVAIGAFYVIHRYRKIAIPVSAAIVFFGLYFLLQGSIALYLILEGTLLFYFLVMVSEPKTSPILKPQQIIYGSLVGLMLALGLHFHFLEASLIALLLGNLYTSRKAILGLIFPQKAS